MATATAILFSFLTLLVNKLIKIIEKINFKKLIEPQISFLLRCLSRILNINCAEFGPGRWKRAFQFRFYGFESNLRHVYL